MEPHLSSSIIGLIALIAGEITALYERAAARFSQLDESEMGSSGIGVLITGEAFWWRFSEVTSANPLLAAHRLAGRLDKRHSSPLAPPKTNL